MSTTIVLERESVSVLNPPASEAAPPGPMSMSQPDELILGSLQHPVVRLRREIRLAVRRSKDEITISWQELEFSATGHMLSEAVTCLQRKIADAFLAGTEHRHFGTLQEYIATVR